MYIPQESFDSKVLRWSGLALVSFIATVFAVGLATKTPSALVSKPGPLPAVTALTIDVDKV